jgi:hypothetical protein
MATDTASGREHRAAAQADAVQGMLDDLQDAHAEGRKLSEELVTELADCKDRLSEVTAVLEAVVRHARTPVAVVDGDLFVRLASPSAAELLGGGTENGMRRSLHPLLPPGGAAEVRRCLVAAPRGDLPVPEDDPEAEARPATARLLAGPIEVTVERVCALPRPLGGLWGGWVSAGRRGSMPPGIVSPRLPYGLVTLRVVDAGRGAPAPTGGAGDPLVARADQRRPGRR